jgi:hypothetical protein
MENRKDYTQRPWSSIAASIIPASDKRLEYGQSLDSPCMSCTTSPCCTYLPLTTFTVGNLSELDYAVYVLNFESIELGVANNGDWSVYYRHPCRFLDQGNFKCTLHDKLEQPHICVRYNPYQCWYKRTLTNSVTAQYIRLDELRLKHLVSRIRFNEYGDIVESPNWEQLVNDLSDPAFSEPSQGHTGQISEHTETEDDNQYPAVVKEDIQSKVWSYEELQNPCKDCQAYCCRMLYFPQYQPVDTSGLDYLKFCLGFRGVVLGISVDGWSLIVNTRCRHLADSRCMLFGKQERPLVCKYYDEWKCSYKLQFLQPQRTGFLLLELEQFNVAIDLIKFDSNGTITHIPLIEEMRSHLALKQRKTTKKAQLQDMVVNRVAASGAEG